MTNHQLDILRTVGRPLQWMAIGIILSSREYLDRGVGLDELAFFDGDSQVTPRKCFHLLCACYRLGNYEALRDWFKGAGVEIDQKIAESLLEHLETLGRQERVKALVRPIAAAALAGELTLEGLSERLLKAAREVQAELSPPIAGTLPGKETA